MDDITEAIYFLENNHLIYLHPRIDNFYKLTPKGESFIRFLREALYTATAKRMATESGIRKHPVYWDLARTHPEYEPEIDKH